MDGLSSDGSQHTYRLKDEGDTSGAANRKSFKVYKHTLNNSSGRKAVNTPAA
ncbi:Uncharacterised protein [Yersinia pekkanenii]|uniref:Uncharacterized protein n=1 Tax=Yersinia pekkanenii TaxID=1288385 RepID=A0A0T9Q085_9GAMM|nr:Uncharacterised protein [Yersinia pekkanenii]CRY67777.1 Uncharacterised protein [Yersinia pekkanenii]